MNIDRLLQPKHEQGTNLASRLLAIEARIKDITDLFRGGQIDSEERRELLLEKQELEQQKRELVAEQRESVQNVEQGELLEVLLDTLEAHGVSLLDMRVLRSVLPQLPSATIDKYVHRLTKALENRNEVDGLTAVQGVVFELSRIDVLLRQGLETIDYDAFPTEQVGFHSYDKKDTSFEHPPAHWVERVPEPDVPLVRDGGLYLYEAKSYPRMPFGRLPAQRNQLLKYQAAVAQEIASGATVELRGRIDRDFLRWATGTAVGESGAIPDVELLYTFELPSGGEYRFDLNRPKAGGGLRFKGEGRSVTPEATISDMRERDPVLYERMIERWGSEDELLKQLELDKKVIQGIQRSRIDKSVIDIITETDIEDPSSELKGHLNDPMTINSLSVFQEYETKRHESIYRRLLESRQIINETNEKNACSEWATEAFVENSVREYQRYLEQNPEMARIKKAYILHSEEDIQATIALAMQHIDIVRNFELNRRQRELENPSIVEPRKQLGYVGLPEGVALDIEHIVIDAIQEVNRTEGKSGRSYEQPERFRQVESLPEYLKTQDRHYLEVTTYDPLGDTSEVSKDVTDKHIVRSQSELEKQNIVRAESQLEAWKQRLTGLKSFPEDTLDLDTRSEFRFLQGRMRAWELMKGPIQRHVFRIDELDKEKVVTVRAERDNAKKKEIVATYDAQIKQERMVLTQCYQEIIGGRNAWNALAKQISEIKNQNIIKFIYVVNSSGEVVVDEERVRGSNTTGRAAHSELAQGRNVYGAGELAFEKDENGWKLVEVNNGSGHYRPSSLTLEYVKNLLAQKGIDVKNAETKDTILRGASIPEVTMFEE